MPFTSSLNTIFNGIVDNDLKRYIDAVINLGVFRDIDRKVAKEFSGESDHLRKLLAEPQAGDFREDLRRHGR